MSCDFGYQHQNGGATAKCVERGLRFRVCVSKLAQRHLPRCPSGLLVQVSDPPTFFRRRLAGVLGAPQIPHIVIVGEPDRNLFEVDSSIDYECEDGYTLDRPARRPSAKLERSPKM